MKTFYDVQQLLKKFGHFLYMGDRILDMEMMETEIKEMYLSGLISKEDMHEALSVLRNERIQEKKNRTKSRG
ncbi:YqgQ family protein [Lederbergia sp. NSJ-179]|uniref:YqgQ family protein n=1 Tax=Lederbergia sp. NSJ-179 TaxID=2931402 RepID=UPI001FD08BB7|nr:YqgQ family protein [Lederbergia sp. NSJ-179]MCJ7843411.1 YqgQ family protein [Lederbergia sp. NSJ-179]